MTTNHTATRDEILAGRNRQGYSLELDSKAHLEIVSADEGAGYAISRTTGLIYRFETTGQPRRHMVRVRVIPATDTGDLAGTLAFDPANRMGGRISAYLWAIGAA